MITNPITTKRLVLRNMKPRDAENVFSIWGHPIAGKYFADEFYKNADELQELFADVDEWEDYSFVAFDKITGDFIGTCSIGPEGDEGEWGFGFGVIMHHWGRGYATEMAKALIDFGYGLGIRNFRCQSAIENVASCRVMQKCGMSAAYTSSYKKRGTDIVYPSYIWKMKLAD